MFLNLKALKHIQINHKYLLLLDFRYFPFIKSSLNV
jgi:hypothetical protein